MSSCPKCGGCGYARQTGCAQEELCGCVDAHVKEALTDFTFEDLAHASSGSDVFSRAVAEAFKNSLPEGVEFERGKLFAVRGRSGFEITPNRKTPVPDVLDFLRAPTIDNSEPLEPTLWNRGLRRLTQRP